MPDCSILSISALCEGVVQGFTFKNNGVIENGMTYASLKEYRKAKEHQKSTE